MTRAPPTGSAALPPALSPPDPPPLREVIARHGLRAKRSLGQHFLLDLNLTRRIVGAAGDLAGSHVVEIGPGPGGLTRALLDSAAASVVAVERDDRCLAALAELATAYPHRLRCVAGDALVIDPATLCPAPRAIVANLPYNIGTQLVLNWLAAPRALTAITVMLQKEVAQRLAAQPGTKSYGRLSVIVQWLCDVRVAFDVAATAFAPPPNVTSSVVRLVPRARPLFPAERATLERVTAAAFGQRRKMLRTSLKQLVADPLPVLAEAGIDPRARGEALSIEELCELARAFAGRR